MHNSSVFRLRFERTWLAGLLVALSLALAGTDVLRRWDNILLDAQTRIFHRAAPPEVVIVAIDEASLAAVGRWPWPRRRHAQLLDRLTQAGAKAVGVDILFAEPDGHDPEGDRLLASAIQRHGRVALAVAPEIEHGGQLGATLPLPELAAGARLGHVDVELDADGIVRRAFLRAGMEAADWPALGLAVLQLGDPQRAAPLSERRHDAVPAHAPGAWVRAGAIVLSFHGAPGSFQRVSAAQLLQGDPAAAERVRGRYVLVGTTAAGIGAALATPVSGQTAPMPGVELTANLLASLMAPHAVQPIGPAAYLALSATLALLPLLVYPRCRARTTLLAYVGLLALVLLCCLALLLGAGLWFPPSAALVTVALSYPLWSWRCLNATVWDLTAERNRVAATLASIGDAVVTADRAGRIEYLNAVAEALTGQTLREARGRPLPEVIKIRDETGDREVMPPLQECLVDGKGVSPSRHQLLLSATGAKYAIRWSANPVRDASGAISGMVLGFSDVSEMLSLSREMVRQATHDALTDLPNRLLLEDRIGNAVARARRGKKKVALLFIDLDGFKKVNDAFGHAAGDALLKEVAQRLSANCRDEDSIARWGGDEFVVVLDELETRDGATAAAAKLLELLAQPFRVLDHEVYVTASIGISVFPRDGDEVGVLFKRADAALYRAKDRGGNSVQFYSKTMSDRALNRLDLEKSLWAALRRDELRLYYQPQIEVAGGHVSGVEALLRWQRSDGALMLPGQFLDVAEQSDLIQAIGQWVLQNACAQLAELRVAGLPALHLAVNLAPRQLLRRELYSRVVGLARDSGIDPSTLVLEISENLFLQDFDGVTQRLNGLRRLGVRVSIDDFGTGYSSIGYLKRLPIDEVKIDKSFVRNVTTNADDLAIVRGVVSLAHSLRLRVVAEGVETAAQQMCLEALGCDGIQGFHIGRPMPPSMLATYLAGRALARNANASAG